MFTGIVREIGRIASLEGGESGLRIELDAPLTAEAAALGDSVAVNGVCLTVEKAEAGRMTFHAVEETLRRSTFEGLHEGDPVNVEPAVRAGEPLGGHYVQGHVDAVGRVRSTEREGEDLRVHVEAPADILQLCVEKGSITVDGVALTVAELDGDTFGVALVPHTLSATTLAALEAGSQVNLEADVLAKYVQRLLAR